MSVWAACMSVAHVCVMSRSHQSLGLELHMVVSSPVRAGNWSWILWKNNPLKS